MFDRNLAYILTYPSTTSDSGSEHSYLALRVMEGNDLTMPDMVLLVEQEGTA
jgi:hypothetical protein